MSLIERPTRRIVGADPANLPIGAVIAEGTPVIFPGAARNWPLVDAALNSPAAAADYLKRFYTGRPVVGFTGAPEIAGRFFYNSEMTGLNFESARVRFDEFVDTIIARMDEPLTPSYYIGSTDLDTYLPGLRQENTLPLPEFAARGTIPIVSLWLGNRTTATAHFDMSNNIAVCVGGRRRFTLFPPRAVEALYPGPLEPTPGGQVVSMVDFRAPDLARYPRFAEAVALGEVADLLPGDVLVYPALWWHHVEALDRFNILINYWWNDAPAFMDSPWNTVLHGILSLRDRPAAEKAAWRDLFEYYVFGTADHAAGHLPEHARGNLAPLDDLKARRLRALLLNRLNR